MAELSIAAGLERLAEVRAFVRTEAGALGADERAVDDLVQAVDEWVTNVLVHGYRGDAGPIEVEVAADESGIVVRVRDRAPAFDPHTAPRFDPSVPLEQRRLGGMGIHLMRELCTAMEYRPLPGGGNEVTLHRTLTEGTGGDG